MHLIRKKIKQDPLAALLHLIGMELPASSMSQGVKLIQRSNAHEKMELSKGNEVFMLKPNGKIPHHVPALYTTSTRSVGKKKRLRWSIVFVRRITKLRFQPNHSLFFSPLQWPPKRRKPKVNSMSIVLDMRQ